MRITYLHQYFKTPEMSGSTRSYEMARRLVAAGHDVHVVTSDSRMDADNLAPYTTVESGIHVHWIPVPYDNRMSYSQRVKAFLQFAWKSARVAAGIKSDVVFATSTPLTIALPGTYAARRNRVPFVFEVRDLWPELPIAMGALKNKLTIAVARALERFAYRNSQRIVALSPGMKAGIVKCGIDPDLVTLIPNSSDIDLFNVPAEDGLAFRRQYDWLQDRPLVIYTGTLGLINGVDYLARLAAEMWKQNPEVRFLVVGSGQQEDFIRQRARELGVLDRNFFMLKRLPKCEIPSVFSAADISTSVVIDLPELWANSANKFFDTLAAGRPVAINHEGWLADLIRERHLGLVLDPHDLPAAANAMSKFLASAREQGFARESALKTARELFDRDQLARKLEEVLNSVHQHKLSRATCRSELSPETAAA